MADLFVPAILITLLCIIGSPVVVILAALVVGLILFIMTVTAVILGIVSVATLPFAIIEWIKNIFYPPFYKVKRGK